MPTLIDRDRCGIFDGSVRKGTQIVFKTEQKCVSNTYIQFFIQFGAIQNPDFELQSGFWSFSLVQQEYFVILTTGFNYPVYFEFLTFDS